ncbi:uncharacterized protein EV420DRAFT_1566102 [Desarmillaria tabescens]|uniref:Uncharacterized protein n=1 Tax=Armillaria tabescens TaxID=1929756 RepID=A0AA39MW86_ARMTA|nr:uncharacterized protein EV420DRAFT_1566102 [Desarmillaria tabescens]KAK0448907.1 hypothetical protein EV420DRAFT_1566102 [Desarmillaria tabescens]
MFLMSLLSFSVLRSLFISALCLSFSAYLYTFISYCRSMGTKTVLTVMKEECWLFVRCPQELAEETAKTRPPIPRRKVFIPPPPGYMRVLFYTHPRYATSNRDPCFEHDFQLTGSGDLNMIQVQETFGLETCSIISPSGKIVCKDVNFQLIFYHAMLNLCDSNGCLRVTEPYVSDSVRMQRNVRWAMLSLPRSIILLVCAVCGILYDLTLPIIVMSDNILKEIGPLDEMPKSIV